MDTYEAQFIRAYDRYKSERRALIYTSFLVVLIEFANFKITGVRYGGLEGNISWNIVSNYILPVILFWFIAMHIQATWHYYTATYKKNGDTFHYISGPYSAYVSILNGIVLKDANIEVTDVGILTDDNVDSYDIWKHTSSHATKSHKFRALINLIIFDYRILADAIPVFIGIFLLIIKLF